MHEAHKIYYYSPILAKPTDKAFFILADSLLFRSENVERLLAKLFGSVIKSNWKEVHCIASVDKILIPLR